MITFNCPECGLLTKAKDREAGTYVRCEKCNEPVWVAVDEMAVEFKSTKEPWAISDFVFGAMGIVVVVLLFALAGFYAFLGMAMGAAIVGLIFVFVRSTGNYGGVLSARRRHQKNR